MNSVLHLKYTRIKQEQQQNQSSMGKKVAGRSHQSESSIGTEKTSGKERGSGSSGSGGSGSANSETGSTAATGDIGETTSMFANVPGQGVSISTCTLADGLWLSLFVHRTERRIKSH